MPSAVRSSVECPEHTRIDHFAAAPEDHGRQRTDQRIPITEGLPGQAIQKGADSVRSAPTASVRRAAPNPAGPNQQLRRIQRIDHKRRWHGHCVSIADTLLQACRQYPNLRIFDWAAAAQDGWFISDGIHYTPAGYAARAHLIARALARAFPRSGHAAGCVIP